MVWYFRFVLVNAGVTYLYFSNFQQIDEEEFGGIWELTKEGFMTSFAGFLVIWSYLVLFILIFLSHNVIKKLLFIGDLDHYIFRITFWLSIFITVPMMIWLIKMLIHIFQQSSAPCIYAICLINIFVKSNYLSYRLYALWICSAINIQKNFSLLR